MKTKQNLLGICLLGALLLLPAVVQAQFNFFYNNGSITISGYTGSGGSITIPSTMNGLPVTRIGYEAFAACSQITSITIPASITNIGALPIIGCSGMSNITVDVLNPNYASVGGILFDKYLTPLIECPGGMAGNVVVPAVSKAFKTMRFNSYYLTSMTIPGSATSIGTGRSFNASG